MWWDQSLHLRVGSFSYPDAKILTFFHPSKGVERYAKVRTDIERYETEKQATVTWKRRSPGAGKRKIAPWSVADALPLRHTGAHVAPGIVGATLCKYRRNEDGG